MSKQNDANRGTGFLAFVQRVLAAEIGVQSKADKERDFIIAIADETRSARDRVDA